MAYPRILGCVGAFATSLCFFSLLCAPAFADDESFFGKVGSAVGDTVEGVGDAVSDAGNSIDRDEAEIREARAEIDAAASKALSRLLRESATARALFPKSYGYAVFDTRKFSFGFTSGTGSGVAIDNTKKNRTYMRMATAGTGLGVGMQFFNVVFLFENNASMNRFISSGWEANAAATATFGEDSLEQNARFVEGLAIFQLNDTGMMADLNITGTKYWKSDELNGVS